MGQQFLIDSNAIIDYLGSKLPENKRGFMDNVINNIPVVSIISKIEVLGFNTPSESSKILEDFFADALILELNNQVVDQSIALRRMVKMKTPDAIIAATALVYDLTLITHNASDFRNIPNLKIIDPHAL